MAFTSEDARRVGEQIGIDWPSAPFDVEQFRAGMDVELEHGARDPETNVTDDDAVATGKIALAHLHEFADYYTRLAVMERAAEAGIPSQQVLPYLFYEDLPAAVAWLARAFGAEEVAGRRMERGGGVVHTEVAIGDAHVLCGAPGGSYRSPAGGGQASAVVYLYVEDVDAHHARAVAAGAEIVEEPHDLPFGDRRYAARDAEGQTWYFAQRFSDPGS